MAANTTDDRPCGLYRTTEELEGKLPAGRLVYYHNHGDPGPGVYPAASWSKNKASFSKRGILLPQEGWERTLEPLPAEGFYRVDQPFYCCENQCRRFDQGQLVQLGYNGRGEAILFVPIWSPQGLELPERGSRINDDRLAHLAALKVDQRFPAEPTPLPTPPRGSPPRGLLH